MKSIKPFNLINSFILFFFLHISYAHIENTHDHEREKWFFQDSSGPFIAEFISFNGSDVFLKQKNKIFKYELSKFSMEDQLTILKKDELVKKINTTSSIKKYSDSKVVVQGFGNVGRYAALASYEEGAKVIAVNDLKGGVYNEKGLNIPELFKHIAKENTVDGFPGGDPLDSEILELECDVLIPAAVGGVITSSNAQKIKARVIVEGANSPTTLNADKILRDNDILIIPDILANAGGVTGSYFEWVQNTQNYLWKEKELYEKLIDVLTSSFEEIWVIAEKNKCDLRTASLIKGIKRVAAAKLTRGLFP